MKTYGLLLTLAGWLMVLRGISRKRRTKTWLASTVASVHALYLRTRRRVRDAWNSLKDQWVDLRLRVWNWCQDALHRLFGKPRNIRGVARVSMSSTLSAKGTVTIAPPTPDSNSLRIQELERRLTESDEETFVSDGWVAVGGLTTVAGALLMALA